VFGLGSINKTNSVMSWMEDDFMWMYDKVSQIFDHSIIEIFFAP